MATYIVNSPDGRKFKVNAPDDASQDDIIAYAKQNMPTPQEAEGPSLGEEARFVGSKLGSAVAGVGKNILELNRRANEVAAKVPGIGLIAGARAQVLKYGEDKLAALQKNAQDIESTTTKTNPSLGREVVGGLLEAAPQLPVLAALGTEKAIVAGGATAINLPTTYHKTYDEVLAQSNDPAKAKEMALKVTAATAPVDFLGMFLGLKGASALTEKWATGPIKGAILSAAGFAPSAAIQAGTNSVLEDVIQGKEPNWDKAQHAAVVSGISNSIMGIPQGVHEGFNKGLETSVKGEMQGQVPEEPTKAPETPPISVEDLAHQRMMDLEKLKHDRAKIELFTEQLKQTAAQKVFDIDANSQVEAINRQPVEADAARIALEDKGNLFHVNKEGEVRSDQQQSNLKEEAKSARDHQEAEESYQRMKAQGKRKPESPLTIKTGELTPDAREAPEGTEEQNTKLEDLSDLEFSHDTPKGLYKEPNKKADIAAVVKSVVDKFTIKPDIQIFDDFYDESQVKASVRDEAIKRGLTNPQAFRKGNTVYLNASAIHSNNRVIELLHHEAFGGHIAQEIFHGPHLDKAMAEVITMRAEEAKAIAKDHGYDLSKDADGNWNKPKDVKKVGSEIISKLAEKNRGHHIVKRFISMIRDVLRKLGFVKGLSDEDIVSKYIVPARNLMKAGEPRSYKSPYAEAVDFSTRQPTKVLNKIRAELQHELDFDFHITPARARQIKKHLKEIDDEIYDNALENIKKMSKSKKPFSSYDPDFAHNFTDYTKLDDDTLKRLHISLTQRMKNEARKPDREQISNEIAKIHRALVDRGINPNHIPKLTNIDDLGEVPPDTTLEELNQERYARDLEETQAEPQKEHTWADMPTQSLKRAALDINSRMSEMDRDSEEYTNAIKDLEDIKYVLKSRAKAYDTSGKAVEGEVSDENIKASNESDDVEFSHDEKIKSLPAKTYDDIMDNARSASDFLKKDEDKKEVSDLGHAIQKHVDAAQVNRGMIQKEMVPISNKVDSLGRKEKQAVVSEVGQWLESQNSGKKFDLKNASKDAQEFAKAIRRALDAIGAKMKKLGMMATTEDGEKIPFEMRPDFVPAILLPKVRSIITNPKDGNKDYTPEFVELAKKMKAGSTEEAHALIRGILDKGNFESGFYGDMGMTKELPFPIDFYDHSVDAVKKYMDRAAERLGQVEAYTTRDKDGKTVDRFDLALSELDTKDPRYAYISSLRQLIYNERFMKTDLERAGQILNTLATGTQLAGPKSVLNNTAGGVANMMAFSDMESVIKGFSDYTKPELRKTVAELANNLGITSDNTFNILADHEALGISKYSGINKASRAVSDFTALLMGLKRLGPLKHISFNNSENIIRELSTFVAKHQLDSWTDALKNDSLSAKANVFRKFCEEEGIDLNALMKEKVDIHNMDASPQSAKFFRRFVNRLQGSYRLDQVPRWLDTWYGRFLFKYNKYGFQLLRMFDKQVIGYMRDPATRTEGVQNLMKYMAVYSSMGYMTAQVIRALFGDQKLPTVQEFKKVLDDKSKEPGFEDWLYGLQHVGLSMHILGAFGPLSMAYSTYNQYSQFGDGLLSPPGLAPLINLAKFLGKWGFGAKVKDDPKEAFKDTAKFIADNISVVKQTGQAIGEATDKVPSLRAGRILTRARAAVQRYIDATGKIERKTQDKGLISNPFAGLKNKVLNDKVNSALMVGDIEAAKAAYKAQVKRIMTNNGTEADLDNLKSQMSSSIVARRPFAVYGKPGGKEAVEMFRRWAETHLPEKDYQEMKQLDDNYMKAAVDADLISKDWIRHSKYNKAVNTYEKGLRPAKHEH